MKSRLAMILLVLASIAVPIGVAVWFWPSDEEVPNPEKPRTANTETRVKKTSPRAKPQPARTNRVARVAQRPDVRVIVTDEFSPADQKTADAIQSALDDDNFELAAKQMAAASASTNALLRSRAVEALAWFGEKALPELTAFMADADDDVRRSAVDAWDMALSGMEANARKAGLVAKGMQVVTDRDQLESMVMQVDDLSNLQKLDALIGVIEGPNQTASEVAREHYKFWTDEDYQGLEAAQKWLDAQEPDEEQ